jgi:hypothetical protein
MPGNDFPNNPELSRLSLGSTILALFEKITSFNNRDGIQK